MAHTQQLLAALNREPGKCARTSAIARTIGEPVKDVRRRCEALSRLALAERLHAGCYRLTAAGQRALADGFEFNPKGGAHKGVPLKQRRPRRPKRVTFVDRLWRAMRHLGKFTIPDLVQVARIDERDAAGIAGRYLRRLEAVGYVVRLPIRQAGGALTSNGFVRWRVIATGAQAPIWSIKKGRIYDPNTGAYVAPDARPVTIGGAR